jgi:4-amino-4-deoxy-L-arabinose transferase-like glycosyltransferase
MAKRRAQRISTAAPPEPIALETPIPPAGTPPPRNGDTSPERDGQPARGPERTTTATRWLTMERVLWGLVIATATALRLFDLAHFSLTDREASLSMAAFNLLQGKLDAGLNNSPLAVGAAALTFALFGASDVTARIVAVLAGMVPVILTYRLRGMLGRWGALCAALLFAFSASFMHIARSANGEVIALAGMYAVLVGMWEVFERRETRSLYMAAIGLGIALAAGQATYTILLIGGSFALIYFVLRATRALEAPELDEIIAALRQSPVTLRRLGIAFVLAFLTCATAAMFNTLGLQAALNIAAAWLMQWTQPVNQPASYFIQALSSYELLPLVFGLGGLMLYLGRGVRSALFHAWWLTLALTFYTLSPVKTPAALPVILIPLILVAGRAIADLFGALAKNFSLANEGVFVLVGLLTCGIFGINLAGYAQDGQVNHLIVDVIAIGMLVLIGALSGGFATVYNSQAAPAAGDGVSPPPEFMSVTPGRAFALSALAHAVPVLGAVVLAGLTVLFVSAAMNLNFRNADDSHEVMVEAPTTMEAGALKRMLEDLSNRWEGDPHTAAIAADNSIGPSLLWYLRDFRTVRYFDSAPATASEPIVIVAAQGVQPGFIDYASQKIRWRWLPPVEPIAGMAFLRWLMYRGLHDVPPSYDIILYVQMK